MRSGACQLCLALASFFPLPAAASGSPDPVVRLHESALVIDAHADIEIPGQESRYAGADGRSQVAPDKMRAGGVDVVVMAIAVGPGPDTPDGLAEARRVASDELDAVRQIVEDNDMVLARSPNEVIAAHRAGKASYILGFQNARILGEDVSMIDAFHEQGVRVFALTHMGHNAFADSSRPTYIADLGRHEAPRHGGLSPLGRKAIRRINELGDIVDVSQLSKEATLQAIELSSAPVIASHSNVRSLTNVSRNLSDEEIDRIAAGGGVIHVAPFRGYLFDSGDADLDRRIRMARKDSGIEEDYYYPFELYWEIEDPARQQAFLGAVSDLLGPGSVEDVVRHIDYIVRRVGVDHVGIGTDFNHGSGVDGYSDASDALNVTRELVARGYSDDDIRKIWGGNFMRVFREVRAGAER